MLERSEDFFALHLAMKNFVCRSSAFSVEVAVIPGQM